MAAGCPALCKQGRSSPSVPSFRPFSTSAPRLVSLLVLLASLSLLPIGWSSGIVVRSAGTVSGDVGGDGSPQLLAYRPLTTEQGTTGDGAFIFRKLRTCINHVANVGDEGYVKVLKLEATFWAQKYN